MLKENDLWYIGVEIMELLEFSIFKLVKLIYDQFLDLILDTILVFALGFVILGIFIITPTHR